MLKLFADALLSIILGWIAYQDFKERKVYLLCYPALLLVVLLAQHTRCDFDDSFKEQCIINNCVITFQFLVIAIYMQLIRGIKFTAAIGVGDILFYYCITPYMSVTLFMLFNILSLLITVILYIFFKKSFKDAIPLAGIQAVCFIGLQVYDYCTPHVLGTCYTINSF